MTDRQLPGLSRMAINELLYSHLRTQFGDTLEKAWVITTPATVLQPVVARWRVVAVFRRGTAWAATRAGTAKISEDLSTWTRTDIHIYAMVNHRGGTHDRLFARTDLRLVGL